MYAILWRPSAEREFLSLAPEIRKRMSLRIDALAQDPRPAGSRKLADSLNRYRLRVGEYRVVYEVRDQALLILVVRVAHRREVYRGLSGL